MHPFVDFSIKSIDKRTQNMYYKSKYTHQYHIMDGCNCSNEIIIIFLSISMIYHRKFQRSYVTHRSIVGHFQ